MTVFSEVKNLTAISFNEDISSSRIQDLYKAACAAYELCFNTPAPSASPQTYAGHDHTPNGGGGPIFRGGLWSALGRNGLNTKHLSSCDWTSQSQQCPLLGTYAGSDLFCYVYPSPALTPESAYEAQVLLEAYYDYEYIIERNGLEVLRITGGGSAPEKVWVKVPIPTTHNFDVGFLETVGFYVTVNAYREEEPPRLRLFGLIISEVPTQVPQRGEPVVLDPPSSGGVSIGNFPILAQELVDDDEFLDAAGMGFLVDFSNTLFEGCFDSKAGGYTTQNCKGHDHASHGGRSVARGMVSSARTGDFLYSVAGVPTSFTQIDNDEPRPRSTDGFGTIRGWVSEGFTSPGNEPTEIYLTCEIEFSAQGAEDTVVFRVNNINTSYNSPEYSQVIGIEPQLFKIKVDRIPCQGGVFNEWTLQVKSGTGDPTVTIVSCVLFEVAGVGAVNTSSFEPR